MKSFARVGLLAIMLSAGSLAHAAPPGIEAKGGYWMSASHGAVFIHVRDTTPGKSECVDDCNKVWATVTAEADAVAGAGWTIETQADGQRMWAYEGKPVYTLRNSGRNGYAAESALWLRARAIPWNPEGVTIGRFGLLAKDDGDLLYHVRHATCDEACRTHWRPMPAPDDAMDDQNWSVIKGDDGANVWATGPQKRMVYELRPDVPPPAVSPSMVGINAFGAAPETTPVAMRPGARDVHDLHITKAPKLAPGMAIPPYPMASLRAKEEGLAMLQFCIGATGGVTSHTLAIPTGFPRLDEATRAWAPTLTFIPGEVDGAPAETCGYALQFDWVIR